MDFDEINGFWKIRTPILFIEIDFNKKKLAGIFKRPEFYERCKRMNIFNLVVINCKRQWFIFCYI